MCCDVTCNAPRGASHLCRLRLCHCVLCVLLLFLRALRFFFSNLKGERSEREQCQTIAALGGLAVMIAEGAKVEARVKRNEWSTCLLINACGAHMCTMKLCTSAHAEHALVRAHTVHGHEMCTGTRWVSDCG